MNEIISLEKITDYDKYNPILILHEDLDYDNQFYVLNTDMGNIAFSYYDLGKLPIYTFQKKYCFCVLEKAIILSMSLT